MRIAKTAALILAITPLLAVAQRSGGRSDRKPSPATSATSAPTGQSGAASIPVVPAARQPIPSQNVPRPNTNPNVAPFHVQPAPPQPVMRPAAAIQPSPTASPVVAPLAANLSTAPVPAPATMAPPTPEPTATVHYAQGQLTVSSQNASLGMLLKLISAKTGATIDLAPELQNEPVIAQIGPKTVQEVMSALLDSPKIDYIIMGSGAADGGLQRILVRTRQSFGRTEFAGGRQFQPPQPTAETEFKLNENVPPVAGVAKPQTQLTQEQLMANWQKVREEKRLAEIEQQQKDRENEASNVEPPPQPEPQTQPVPQPNGADNPPLN
ncbi:MAG: hypothetical protein ACJ71W_04540 [Terriglobales bacterium]